ncbi:hypothetical protein BD0068_00040 [Helicobacter pylori]|uniref:hypothetical protein n=1 Tax=Helicobacter pylori TaxID=210 RepID=UPI0036F40F67
MRNYVGAGSFILIIKNTQRHQFDTDTPVKSKDFKKAVVFKRDSPNTGRSDRELKAQI